MKILVLLASICFCLVACSRPAEPQQKLSINWFEGPVESAFKHAEEQKTPVFLYWGAIWCPPCQEIKHTVFKTRRFIAQSESFVPVYLDGDTPEAQRLGEEFGVKGYPTMIVFSPAGDEITRIPGGIDISQYNDILELALNSIRPTRDLVEMVTTEPQNLSENDLKQLAFYSWGQDHRALPDDYEPELFLTMSNLAEDEVSSARLYMQYLSEVSKSTADTESNSSIVPVVGALTKISSILKSDKLTLACWDSLAYYATELLPHIANDKDQAAIKSLWQRRLQSLSTDPTLSVAEQLAGILPRLEFYFQDDENLALDKEIERYVRQMTQSADDATKNSFARQSVISQINYILQAAGMKNEAKELLLRELELSKSPYYFMSSLASLAEKENNIDEALEWRKKAYESARGNATRFQWGASYIRAIIRLQPENETGIQSLSIALLDELENSADAFAGRNFRILQSLNKQLSKWQADKAKELLVEFKISIDERCREQIDGSLEATNCIMLTSSG